MNIAIVIFWIFAGWFYQQHEHVKFNYSGSIWNKLDNGMRRPWFKNNSRPDIRSHLFFKYLPFLWDGYHFFSWAMKFCYWMILASMLYEKGYSILFIFLSGIGLGIANYLISQLTYKWTFKND